MAKIERHLQFRRNNIIYPDYESCKAAILALETSTTVNLTDGEQVFGRYHDTLQDGKIVTLVGYVQKSEDTTSITITDGVQLEHEIESAMTSVSLSSYVTNEYDEAFKEKTSAKNVTSSMTIADAISTVENAVDLLIDETIINEKVISNTFSKIVDAAGFSDASGKISYQQHTTDKFLSGATSLDEADIALSRALDTVTKELTGGTTNITDALDKLNDELEHRTRISGVTNGNGLKLENEVLRIDIDKNLTDIIVSGTSAQENIHKNIISANKYGLYAFADLHYDEATNKLTFVNTHGTNEIKLTGINFLSAMTYNSSAETIDFVYQAAGESGTSVTQVPLSGLIEEYSFQCATSGGTEYNDESTVDNHNVSIKAERSVSGSTIVYGDIDIFDCGTF